MINILASSLRDKGDINTSIEAENEAFRPTTGPNRFDALVTLWCNYKRFNMASSAKRVAESIASIDINFSVGDYIRSLPYTDNGTLKGIEEALLSAGLTK